MGSIKKNFVYNSIYQILALILPFITTPYISRVLGAENIGVYSYTYSVAYYFVLVAMLGVNNYGNRSCARVRDDKFLLSKTFCEIYALQLILSILSSVVYISYVVLFSTVDIRIALYQTLYVLSAAFDINWFFFSIEKFKVTISRNLFVKLLTMILIFLCVKSEASLGIYTLIMAGGVLISQIVVWPFLKKSIFFVKPKFREIIKHLKPNIVLFVPAVAVSVYKYMDKIMIGTMSTMLEEGFYAQAEKIIQIPLGFISALGTVMLPRMSNLVYNKRNEESKELIYKSMLFISFLSSALVFGLAGIASDFIPLFLGNGYDQCVDILVGLSFSVLFVAWANVIRTQYLIPQKKDSLYLITVVVGAIVNCTINLLLIKPFGAMGAVIGTIFAEASVAVSQSILVRKELPIKSYLCNGIPFLFVGWLMFYFLTHITFTNLAFLNLMIKIFFGGLLYLTVSAIIIWVFQRDILRSVILVRRRKK
uniref:flippase n=1 Tax=Enterocloster clostridioformis TaxID=1531 RepID=UPI0026EFAF82|nr:flippase [Enterocloster clostridioformis]